MSLLWLVLAGSASTVSAHDIPQRSFDRAIEATIEPHRVRIIYHLSLSRLTLADELLSLVGAGGLSGTVETERLELYGSKMAPLLAHGLILKINNQPFDLSIVGTSQVVEEHPRFQFEFVTTLESAAVDVLQLKLEDTSFYLEKGRVRIAIRADAPCKLVSSTVPGRLEEVVAKSAWEMTPEQQDAARRAEASWTCDGTADSVPHSTREAETSIEQLADPPPDGLWRRIRDLTQLLDHWSHEYSAILLTMAFGFGAAHAMTPGHGKTMVAAYLVGERGTMRHAVALGLTTSLTHTSSVLIVALILRLVGKELQDKLSTGIALLSGVLVAGLGAFLLFARLRGRIHSRVSQDGNGVTGENCGHLSADSDLAASAPGWASLLTLGVSGGLIPCPDAIALLFIATAKGEVEQAVYLLLSFSAGLASALVLVGVMAVKLRGFLTSPLGSGRIVQSLPIVSAAAILAVGVYLCVSTLERPRAPSFTIPAATRTAGP